MGDIGFIGLGIMGRGMVGNLLAAGHDVTVWNRTEERAIPFAELGATVAATPAEVAQRHPIVMLCVSDTPDVEAVVFGDDGVAAALQDDGLIIDHSTISPVATTTMAERITASGGHWLDAPISGGSEGIRNLHRKSWPSDSYSILKEASPSCYPKMAKVE